MEKQLILSDKIIVNGRVFVYDENKNIYELIPEDQVPPEVLKQYREWENRNIDMMGIKE